MPRLLQPDLDLGESLFEQLSRETRQGRGIVRDSYGAGEQAAHDIMRAAAESLGLEVSVDAIGNLMMVLPGADRRAPQILMGSHLDSVPQGGNFDGAATIDLNDLNSVLNSLGTSFANNAAVLDARQLVAQSTPTPEPASLCAFLGLPALLLSRMGRSRRR